MNILVPFENLTTSTDPQHRSLTVVLLKINTYVTHFIPAVIAFVEFVCESSVVTDIWGKKGYRNNHRCAEN